MKYLQYIVIGLLCLAPVLSMAQSKAEQKVLDTENARFEAMTRSDTVALRPFLHEELFYTHSNAMTETKQQHLAAIAAGKLRYEQMQRGDVTARLYGRKMAITNGAVRVKGILEGKPFEINLLYTAVYRLHKRHWQLLRWQSTRK
jgi:hypothetical protein